jgi:hypothetical protein
MREQLLEHHYIMPSDLHLMRLVHSAEEAVQEISRFYRNYQSSRWLKDKYVIRMNHPLNEAALLTLDKEFRDLCISGDFQQQPMCASEATSRILPPDPPGLRLQRPRPRPPA